MKRFEDALTCYSKAIELNPNDGLRYYNMGNTYAIMERSKEAFIWMKKAIDINTDFPFYLCVMGKIYSKMDK